METKPFPKAGLNLVQTDLPQPEVNLMVCDKKSQASCGLSTFDGL